MENPRDRIYAFLNMPVTETVALNIDPEYTDTTSEIHCKFAEQYVSNSFILDRLFHNGSSPQYDLPTWIPT